MRDEYDVVSPSARRRVAVGLADQIVFSATNFAVTVVAARHSSAADFGGFALVFATLLIVTAVNRGLTAEPLVVRTSAHGRREWSASAPAKLGLALAFGVVAGLLVFALSMVALPSRPVLALAFGIAAPVVVAQDLVRYAALAAGRPGAALRSDLTVCMVQLACIAAFAFDGSGSLESSVLGWVGATAAGLLVGAFALSLYPVRPTRVTLRADRDLSLRFAADNLITQLSQQGVVYVVAAVAGLSAAGGFRIAQTVYMPLGVLVLGLQSAVLPELVRIAQRSAAAMLHAAAWSAVALVAGTIGYIGLAVAVPDHAGEAAFGAAWSTAQPLILLMGVPSAAGAAIYCAVSGVRALGDAARALRVRGVTIAVMALTVVPGAVLDGARGAAIGLAAGTVLQAVYWWRQFGAAARLATSSRRPADVTATYEPASHPERG